MSKNEKNMFVVDLGQLELTADDQARINAAIQKAVAGELALTKLNQRVALLPSNPLLHGILTRGIVARVLDQAQFDNLLNAK